MNRYMDVARIDRPDWPGWQKRQPLRVDLPPCPECGETQRWYAYGVDFCRGCGLVYSAGIMHRLHRLAEIVRIW